MSTSSPHEVLGLSPGASIEQVKDAFRSLSKKFHPDLCPPENRQLAESRFKEIAAAYQSVLKGEAGYAVPPPGTPPNPKYTAAYWGAQGKEPPKPYGRYAGFHSEWEYYRSWFRGGAKNSTVLLSMATLIGVPIVGFLVTSLQGESETMKRIKEDGLDAFKGTWEVNGMKTPVNPYAPQHAQDSYIFKHEKYAHLRERKTWQVPKPKSTESNTETTNAESS